MRKVNIPTQEVHNASLHVKPVNIHNELQRKFSILRKNLIFHHNYCAPVSWF